MQPQAQDHHQRPTAGRAQERTLPRASRRRQALLTPQSPTPSVQSYKRMCFCCLNHAPELIRYGCHRSQMRCLSHLLQSPALVVPRAHPALPRMLCAVTSPDGQQCPRMCSGVLSLGGSFPALRCFRKRAAVPPC